LSIDLKNLNKNLGTINNGFIAMKMVFYMVILVVITHKKGDENGSAEM
jgi:hypothetical protein